MKWHYIEKEEWPENHDTIMVRTLKEFDGMIPAFYIQEQTSPIIKRFFRYDNPDKEINDVEVWCSFKEIQDILDTMSIEPSSK